MTGKVCDKHQEWCPTGECRWCEPEPSETLTATVVGAVVHYGNCPAIIGGVCRCPRPTDCSCGLARLSSLADYYDEPNRYFRHTASRCDAQSAFYPPATP